ncbi:hypothetical protein CMV_012713 [Castanea mollissima]|uniref:Uncharacterized protein n=1 Tax=Castanea mollissima TaxID=60419 RepID=A0A8J4R935_9ROSI|nr:hypothetical protein CMV_012713 [Castanea mollissima]
MATSTTEIGSSSTAHGSGYLALDIKAMFESSKQQYSIGGLISVPVHLRKLDEQAFTPLLISIGPIHRPNAKLQTMKKIKVWFCESFIKRANIDLNNLVQKIRAREKEIRSYYAETVESSIISDDFVTMIVVDGMFILECFLRQSNPLSIENHPKIAEWMSPILKFDLVLLENQLPFFVLEMLFKEANFPAELGLQTLSLRQLAFEFFQCYNFQRIALESFNAKIEHLTDLVRLFYLSEQLPDRRSGGAKLSYSATQLHEAGVKFFGVKLDETVGRYRGYRRPLSIEFLLIKRAFKFIGVEFDEIMGLDREYRGFLDIRFDLKNGVLEIPCIELNDEKIRLIRNIIALEQSLYVGHAYVTDFFVILDFLINTSKDVDLLCDKGILVNYLGDSDAAASAVNNLNTNILWTYMNSHYRKISEDLNAFYKKPSHRWRATLWHQYFSTPWRAASTSAAIILLVLTTIQTVYSIKSTKL